MKIKVLKKLLYKIAIKQTITLSQSSTDTIPKGIKSLYQMGWSGLFHAQQSIWLRWGKKRVWLSGKTASIPQFTSSPPNTMIFLTLAPPSISHKIIIILFIILYEISMGPNHPNQQVLFSKKKKKQTKWHGEAFAGCQVSVDDDVSKRAWSSSVWFAADRKGVGGGRWPAHSLSCLPGQTANSWQ